MTMKNWVMTVTRDSERGRQEGGGRIHCMRQKALFWRIFEGTTRVLLVAVPRGPQLGWSCEDFLRAFCVRHKGQGRGGADAGSPLGSGRLWIYTSRQVSSKTTTTTPRGSHAADGRGGGAVRESGVWSGDRNCCGALRLTRLHVH